MPKNELRKNCKNHSTQLILPTQNRLSKNPEENHVASLLCANIGKVAVARVHEPPDLSEMEENIGPNQVCVQLGSELPDHISYVLWSRSKADPYVWGACSSPGTAELGGRSAAVPGITICHCEPQIILQSLLRSVPKFLSGIFSPASM